MPDELVIDLVKAKLADPEVPRPVVPARAGPARDGPGRPGPGPVWLPPARSAPPADRARAHTHSHTHTQVVRRGWLLDGFPRTKVPPLG